MEVERIKFWLFGAHRKWEIFINTSNKVLLRTQLPWQTKYEMELEIIELGLCNYTNI